MHAEHLVARSVNYPCIIIMIRKRNELYITYTHTYTYITCSECKQFVSVLTPHSSQIKIMLPPKRIG